MFTLPKLPYAYNALQNVIDEQTMHLHHEKHHKGYVDKLNDALSEAGVQDMELEELLSHVSEYSPAVRNNGGGHYNHSLFWSMLSPETTEPTGELAEAIVSTFGSLEGLQQQFEVAATTQFGSGWAWLVLDKGELKIGSTPNQDNPLMDVSEFKGTPILGLDVWEHAYYLKYQNKRAEYASAFWSIVNWNEVERLYEAAQE